LDKQEYQGVYLDIDTKGLEGRYTGAIRGSNHALEIKSISNGITVQSVGDDSIDTLKIYIGNNTWMEGNDKMVIENDEYRVDQTYGYYILKKD